MRHMVSTRPDPAAILEVLSALRDHAGLDSRLGLRERKKLRVRQQISDMATALFLSHGFENVTVLQIAAACEVSEQTVFNHFPTKESMFFDRAEPAAEQMAAALRERDDRSLRDVVISALLDDDPLDGLERWPDLDEAEALSLFRLFCQTADESPALVAAQGSELMRLGAIVAGALAERTDADPDDPEVQIVAGLVLSLSRAKVRAAFRRAREVSSLVALARAVQGDFERAVRLVTPTFDAFDDRPRTGSNYPETTVPPRPRSRKATQ
jgi:AcrR family transcriptional regulator